MNFDKTPFWKAFDKVLDQGGLTLYPYTGERGAFVVSRPPGAMPRSKGAFYNGVFRLEPGASKPLATCATQHGVAEALP